MLLSALALAALLQVAPMAPSAAPTVVIPEAAPVIGRKGYLLQRQPFTADGVEQLRMPLAKRHRAMSPEAARDFAARRPPTPRRPKLQSSPWPPRGFVRGPQATNCKTIAPEPAGDPETLKSQPLSKMPKARLEKAVVRLVDGCPVPVLVAQNGPVR
jgi:hypothetical protein